MFYRDKRAEIIKGGEGNSAKLEGVFEKIKAYYADKSVALFRETCFVSSNHTGILSRKDAIDEKIEDKTLPIIMDGLSYRKKGDNAQLDRSILKTIGRGERITMLNEEQPVIIVGGYANYGHFMFEFLPKIVEGLRLFGNKYEFVVNDSITRWIDIANIISKQMIGTYPKFRIVPYDSCIKSNHFIVIESTRAEGLKYISSKENLNLIQEMSAKGVRSLKADSPKKIYLKRPDNVKWRKIANAE